MNEKTTKKQRNDDENTTKMGRGGDEQSIIKSPTSSGDSNTCFKAFARRLWRINPSCGTLQAGAEEMATRGSFCIC